MTSFDSTNTGHIRNLDELPFWSAPFGFVLLETIRIRQSMQVLDIGSGTGFPLLEIAARLGAGSRLIGIDPWIEALKVVREKIKLRALNHVDVQPIRAESLPFESETFDLIVSNNGLNNVQDFAQALSECRRVCKKEGQLVFTMNLPDTMIEFYRVLEKILLEARLQDAVDRMYEHIASKRKPLNEVQTLLQNAGFTVDQKKIDSFTYRFANADAMFHYYTIREFFLPSWKALIPESKLDTVLPKLEQSLNEAARHEGEIRLTIPFVCFDCSPE